MFGQDTLQLKNIWNWERGLLIAGGEAEDFFQRETGVSIFHEGFPTFSWLHLGKVLGDEIHGGLLQTICLRQKPFEKEPSRIVHGQRLRHDALAFRH